MKMTYTQAIKLILNNYGINHQNIKTIEELSELTKELTKWLNGYLDRFAVVDELADVLITTDQIIAFLDCEDEVKHRMAEKVQRQLTRIEHLKK